MDDVIVNKQSFCAEHADGRREAVVEGTALDVRLVRGDLLTKGDDYNFSFFALFNVGRAPNCAF